MTDERPSLRMLRHDGAILRERVPAGTWRRTGQFVRPYRGLLVVFLVFICLDAGVVAVGPLLFREIIDNAIPERRTGYIAALAAVIAVLAVLDAMFTLMQRVITARIGEGLVCDLRTRLFDHVQAMPLAFFTRTQTGSVVSRLNVDVLGAQTAFTDLMTNVVGSLVLVVFVLTAMATLSWPITLAAIVLLPVLALPVRLIGRRLAGLTRERYRQTSAMTTSMTERFNVSGALLVKLFGDPGRESAQFATRARRIRDVGIEIALIARVFAVSLALAAALATALVYGIGGVATADRHLQIGSVVALAAYLARLYGPLSSLAGAPVDVMTALVSFDRVFEVLDLPPVITDAPDAVSATRGPATLVFDHVHFAYPVDAGASVASLERPPTQRAAAATVDTSATTVLRDVSFEVRPGQLVALVGASGAGKTTIAMLANRLYDVGSGAVRLDGIDLRGLSTASLRTRIGLVTQDPHLFNDTVRANLLYAVADADEADLIRALEDACVADVVAALPDGLDTVVGDRGYRLSGGEKQRLAIARLLLRSPDVVVLDEATAHLDNVSEAAVHRALARVLVGRTALVIAHRLSTVQRADTLLVLDRGAIVERGTHDELVDAGGVYSRLYRTRIARELARPGP